MPEGSRSLSPGRARRPALRCAPARQAEGPSGQHRETGGRRPLSDNTGQERSLASSLIPFAAGIAPIAETRAHATGAQTDAMPMQQFPASSCRRPALTPWDLGRLHSSGPAGGGRPHPWRSTSQDRAWLAVGTSPKRSQARRRSRGESDRQRVARLPREAGPTRPSAHVRVLRSKQRSPPREPVSNPARGPREPRFAADRCLHGDPEGLAGRVCRSLTSKGCRSGGTINGLVPAWPAIPMFAGAQVSLAPLLGARLAEGKLDDVAAGGRVNDPRLSGWGLEGRRGAGRRWGLEDLVVGGELAQVSPDPHPLERNSMMWPLVVS